MQHADLVRTFCWVMLRDVGFSLNLLTIFLQHSATLLNATSCLGWTPGWMMLEDVGLTLKLLKIFLQHHATLLGQQCCTTLASFEQVLKWTRDRSPTRQLRAPSLLMHLPSNPHETIKPISLVLMFWYYDLITTFCILHRIAKIMESTFSSRIWFSLKPRRRNHEVAPHHKRHNQIWGCLTKNQLLQLVQKGYTYWKANIIFAMNELTSLF